METNRPRITPQGFVGVFIVLLGIVFTLDNLGLVESRQLLQYWPLAPLGIGLLIVIHASEPRDWIRGTVWLTAGALFLARNLGWVHFRVESFWPLLLVAFGLHIIFKARTEPTERPDRRARALRRRQSRWQRKLERWQAKHGEVAPPWASDWSAQWQDKWQNAATKIQDEWQHKFHDKPHADWQDKLKHTIQKFAPGTCDKDKRDDVPSDVNAPANAPGSAAPPGAPGVPPGNPAATTGGAPGSAASGAPGSFTTTSGLGAGYASSDANAAPPGGSSGWGWHGTGGIGAGADAFDTRVPPSNAPHRITMFALMGGVTRRINGVPFHGANMTAVMGGIQLDLTQAQLPEDAVIELFAFWGGIEIWVPREWSVVNQGFALMGSIEDKTGNLPQRPGQPRLVLRGMALMGGVEIKN